MSQIESDYYRAIKEVDPSTRLVDLAQEAKAAGLTLRTDRRGGCVLVTSTIHPTIARIRAAMLRG